MLFELHASGFFLCSRVYVVIAFDCTFIMRGAGSDRLCGRCKDTFGLAFLAFNCIPCPETYVARLMWISKSVRSWISIRCVAMQDSSQCRLCFSYSHSLTLSLTLILVPSVAYMYLQYDALLYVSHCSYCIWLMK